MVQTNNNKVVLTCDTGIFCYVLWLIKIWEVHNPSVITIIIIHNHNLFYRVCLYHYLKKSKKETVSTAGDMYSIMVKKAIKESKFLARPLVVSIKYFTPGTRPNWLAVTGPTAFYYVLYGQLLMQFVLTHIGHFECDVVLWDCAVSIGSWYFSPTVSWEFRHTTPLVVLLFTSCIGKE